MTLPEPDQCRALARALSIHALCVLVGLANGKTIKEIAQESGISPKTAEYHRSQIYQACHIHDLATLTRFAIRAGLIEP